MAAAIHARSLPARGTDSASTSRAAGTESPATRAAELPVASAGMYALRKRTRGGTAGDEADGEGEAGEEQGRAAARAGKMLREGSGGAGGKTPPKKGPATAVEPAPVAHGTLRDLVAADKGAVDGGGDGDDSSLTSLSDLEPDPLPAKCPPPARRNPPARRSRRAVDSDDDGGSDYVDDEADGSFNPKHPGTAFSSTSPSRKRHRKASASQKVLKGTIKATASGHKRPAAVVASSQSNRSSPISSRAMPLAHPSGSRRPSLHPQFNSLVDTRRLSLPPPPTPLRCTTDFKPSPMPTIVELFEKRLKILDEASIEATPEHALQQRSENAIETAMAALETGAQQTTLCLAMNRFSAWCADRHVGIPVFPLTAAKLALFLARCTAAPISALLLSVFPQPDSYPLPVADCLDQNLTADEGSRLTRELVKCWIDAFSYAQMATLDIWAPVLGPDADAGAEQHPALRSLQEDRGLREVLGALEPAEHMRWYDEHVRAQLEAEARMQADQAGLGETGEMGPPDVKGKGKAVDRGYAAAGAGGSGGGSGSGAGKTKWVKGGKAVAPPNPSIRAGSSSSGGSQMVPPQSSRSAGSPELAANVQVDASAWRAGTHATLPHGNAFLPTDLAMLPAQREPAFASYASQLAAHFDGEAAAGMGQSVDAGGELFPSTSPWLHRRSSTSNLAGGPTSDASASFPLPPHAAAAFATQTPSHDTLRHLADLAHLTAPYSSVGSGAFGRTRSFTHDPRLQASSSFASPFAGQQSTPHATPGPAQYITHQQEQPFTTLRPVQPYHPQQPYLTAGAFASPRPIPPPPQRIEYTPHVAQSAYQAAHPPGFVIVNGQPYLLPQGASSPTVSRGAPSASLFDGLQEQMHPSPQPRQRWSGMRTAAPPRSDGASVWAASRAPAPSHALIERASGGAGAYAGSSHEHRFWGQAAAYSTPQISPRAVPGGDWTHIFDSRDAARSATAFDGHHGVAAFPQQSHERDHPHHPPASTYLEQHHSAYATAYSPYPPPPTSGANNQPAPPAEEWHAVLPDLPCATGSASTYPTPESPLVLPGGEFPGAHSSGGDVALGTCGGGGGEVPLLPFPFEDGALQPNAAGSSGATDSATLSSASVGLGIMLN